ncbi:MAG: hypothetical protein ACUZ77_01095 [Candidatus Brocadiales bacterium]
MIKLFIGFISLATLTFIAFTLITLGFYRMFNAARDGIAATPQHLFICLSMLILGSLIFGFIFAQSAKD